MNQVDKLILEKVFHKNTEYNALNFSQSMAAAWFIVEKTTVSPFAWVLETDTLANGKIVYIASIWGSYQNRVRSWDAREDSMALAICTAVLLHLNDINGK